MDLTIPGPAGGLEALLEEPEVEPRFAAVVAHPHPVYGGTMRNSVVFRVARALREAGGLTLRFNFRGVEGSEGEHDGEGGEEQDLEACLDHLQASRPGLALWGAGFSFGARTLGALALRDARLVRLVLVALPVEVFDCDSAAEVTQPTLAVWGSEDEFGTLGAFERRYPQSSASIERLELEGADHFFRGRTPRLEAAVLEFALRSVDLSQ